MNMSSKTRVAYHASQLHKVSQTLSESNIEDSRCFSALRIMTSMFN